MNGNAEDDLRARIAALSAQAEERRIYVDRILEERDRQYGLRYQAQEDALATARLDMERRLEGLNELRKAVETDRGRFLSVEKYEAEMRGVGGQLDELKAFQGRILGLMATVAILAGIVGAAVSAIVSHLIS